MIPSCNFLLSRRRQRRAYTENDGEEKKTFVDSASCSWERRKGGRLREGGGEGERKRRKFPTWLLFSWTTSVVGRCVYNPHPKEEI